MSTPTSQTWGGGTVRSEAWPGLQGGKQSLGLRIQRRGWHPGLTLSRAPFLQGRSSQPPKTPLPCHCPVPLPSRLPLPACQPGLEEGQLPSTDKAHSSLPRFLRQPPPKPFKFIYLIKISPQPNRLAEFIFNQHIRPQRHPHNPQCRAARGRAAPGRSSPL